MAQRSGGTVVSCAKSDQGAHTVKVQFPEPPPEGEEVVFHVEQSLYGEFKDAMIHDLKVTVHDDDAEPNANVTAVVSTK